MNAVRKIALICLTSLVLIAPVVTGLAPHVQAQNHQAAGYNRYYTVYYRSCPQDAWRLWGSYYRVSDAQQAVRYFNYYGYQAFYR